MKTNPMRLILFFIFLSANFSFAQKEANIWYFGNGAGIDFNTGTPIAIDDGMLFSNEGCATISDKQGQLLFYSDGVKVWNKHHQQMPNGYGLKGSISSTQSCLFVHKPGSSTLYYMFTISEQASPEGFSYSIIDMSLDGGKGEVTLKNKFLLGPVSEKMTAIQHSNGKDIWIITHQWNSNAFYSYLLNSEGIGSKPVISIAGSVHRDIGSGNKGEAIGYLKASPNGKKLAAAMDKMSHDNVEIFDFDNSSGTISNAVSLSMGNSAYGLSFSPDNSKLYLSSEAGDQGIVQYDLNAANISKSATKVSAKNNTRFGALQIGSDGKIYIATGRPFLDIIENPNALGLACNYKVDALNLNGHYSTFGLPDFWDFSLYNSSDTKTSKDNHFEGTSDLIKKSIKNAFTVNLGNDTSLYCVSELLLDAKTPGATYLWSTGTINENIKVTNSGKYWVRVEKNGIIASDTIKVKFDGKPTSFACLQEFTPNNDGLNDVFDYIISDVSEFKLSIYNSKKKLVFESNDAKKKWDGTCKNKALPPAIYNWEVMYKSKCTGNKPVTKLGEVNLMK